MAKRVAQLTLAVPRSFKNMKGEYDTDYIPCVLWKGVAENTAEYCKKGDLVGIKGRIQTRSYETEDDINLDIKQGQMKMIHGQHKTHSRVLNVALYYNRTFGKVAEKDDPIHKAGSWTMKMRPDYTLSLWPGYIREAEAEHQELVVHIHFDAKYRLNKVILEDQDNGEDGGDILLNEKEQQKRWALTWISMVAYL